MNIDGELSILFKQFTDNHNEFSMANKDQPARKPLRQRVADRKLGIKEVRPMSVRKKRLLRVSVLLLTALQYSGLLFLLLSLGGIVTENYEIHNMQLLTLYCAMFLVGRFGLMIIKSVFMFR